VAPYHAGPAQLSETTRASSPRLAVRHRLHSLFPPSCCSAIHTQSHEESIQLLLPAASLDLPTGACSKPREWSNKLTLTK
jgi:hypothetical protein